MTTATQDFTVPDLCAAAEAGDLPRLREIIAAQPQLATQDTAANDEHQAIHHAVYGNHPQAIQLLLAAGADPLNGIYPHREPTTALAMARDRNLAEIVATIENFLQEQRGTTPGGQEITAAASGDGAALLQLLADDPALANATDSRGQTPLFKAIGRADLSMVSTLLDRNAAVDHRDADGWEPLRRCLFHSWKIPDDHYAAHTAIAGLLIGRGASYGLWEAAALGDAAGVRVHLDAERELLQAPGKGKNPVVVAAFRGHVETLRLLLDAGADPDAPHTIEVAGETIDQWGQPLWLACNRGHYEVAALLLECGARANPAQYASGGAVHWPYQAGDRRLANLLFLHGAVADPLSYCLTGDMAALAEHLQAHPEEREGLPWSALLAGNEDVLDHCLTQGPAIPEERHFNLLSQAIRGWRIGDLKINNEGWDPRSLQRNLERLLAHGYDPNVRNHRSSRANFTILHHLAAKACYPGAYGHTATEIVDFARVLIDAGADPNALEDQLQSTPLGWAARIGNGELVDYLLSRGADPNRAGADWSRPLAWAKKKGHGEIATLLRTQGAEG